MLKFTPAPPGRPLRVLCLGAHSDDIEIGCGGTVLRLIEEHPGVSFHWVVFSGSERRAAEAGASAADFLAGAAEKQVRLLEFRDGFFPYDGARVKEAFEALKGELDPDLVFTHCRHDLHQDHRTLCELTWNTFRDHAILEYEIPKYDADLRSPNLFVQLTEAQARRKVDLLHRHFATQENKHWFTDSTFTAILRLRGIECRAPEGFAEGFYGRKVVL